MFLFYLSAPLFFNFHRIIFNYCYFHKWWRHEPSSPAIGRMYPWRHNEGSETCWVGFAVSIFQSAASLHVGYNRSCFCRERERSVSFLKLNAATIDFSFGIFSLFFVWIFKSTSRIRFLFRKKRVWLNLHLNKKEKLYMYCNYHLSYLYNLMTMIFNHCIYITPSVCDGSWLVYRLAVSFIIIKTYI